MNFIIILNILFAPLLCIIGTIFIFQLGTY